MKERRRGIPACPSSYIEQEEGKETDLSIEEKEVSLEGGGGRWTVAARARARERDEAGERERERSMGAVAG